MVESEGSDQWCVTVDVGDGAVVDVQHDGALVDERVPFDRSVAPHRHSPTIATWRELMHRLDGSTVSTAEATLMTGAVR